MDGAWNDEYGHRRPSQGRLREHRWGRLATGCRTITGAPGKAAKIVDKVALR